MDTMPSEISFWSWALRGLGGSVNLIEQMLDHGPRLSSAQLEILHTELTRLESFADRCCDRLIDQGAPTHGPDTDPILNRPAAGSAGPTESAASDRSY